jgi:hypothetical protein
MFIGRRGPFKRTGRGSPIESAEDAARTTLTRAAIGHRLNLITDRCCASVGVVIYSVP